MKLPAYIISYLVSLIIFILFIKLAYWMTGTTIDLGVLMILYIVISIGNDIGWAFHQSILDYMLGADRKTKKAK